MLLKRIALLCIILITTACKPSTVDDTLKIAADIGLEALEFYVENKTSIDAMATDIAIGKIPTPTFGWYHIEEYFLLASSPDCEIFDDKNIATMRSMVCKVDDNTVVIYDEWLPGGLFLGNFTDYIAKNPDFQDLEEMQWFDEENPDVPLGRFLMFKNNDGDAFIFWTVNDKDLSGWAMRADGDKVALMQWWSETGSDHK